MPFGLLVGLMLRTRFSALASVILGLCLGVLLSASMEYLQMYLPTRVSSNLDLLTNSVGALIGALLAVSMTSWTWLFSRLTHWRRDLFRHGKEMDFGLALLALWMFGQVNPSLPMLGNVFISEVVHHLADEHIAQHRQGRVDLTEHPQREQSQTKIHLLAMPEQIAAPVSQARKKPGPRSHAHRQQRAYQCAYTIGQQIQIGTDTRRQIHLQILNARRQQHAQTQTQNHAGQRTKTCTQHQSNQQAEWHIGQQIDDRIEPGIGKLERRAQHLDKIQTLPAPPGERRQASVHDEQRVADNQPGAQPRVGSGLKWFSHVLIRDAPFCMQLRKFNLFGRAALVGGALSLVSCQHTIAKVSSC